MAAITKLEKYKDYLDRALSYYYGDDVFIKYFNRISKKSQEFFFICK